MATSISLFPTPAERYTVLLELARRISTSFVPAELCRAIYDNVARVLPVTSFTVSLAGAGGALVPQLHVGAAPATVDLTSSEREHLLAGDFVVRTTATHVELLASLLADRRLVGCLVARRGAVQPFDAADAHFLLAVGALSGVALENARLFQELSRRQQEAELLEAVARDLGRSLELEEVARRIVLRAAEVAEAPAALWRVSGDVASTLAAAPEASRGEGERRLPAGAAERIAARVADGHGATLLRAPVEGVGEPNTLLLPLVAGRRLVAVLVLERPELRESGTERVLERLALHALSAITNSLLHEEVRLLSLTDPVVQLPNRRQLDFFLEKEFAAAQRGRPVSFVLFDLDHFKDFNDAHGHQAGDQALIRFADVLRTETRAMNLAARYGGEEFASVLSETTRAGAHGYAQRVRRRMAAAWEGKLTVSAGVAVYAESMTTAAELVAAADRALYRAKQEGRNRVCLADD